MSLQSWLLQLTQLGKSDYLGRQYLKAGLLKKPAKKILQTESDLRVVGAATGEEEIVGIQKNKAQIPSLETTIKCPGQFMAGIFLFILRG